MDNLNLTEAIHPIALNRTQVLVFTSGKGGVGKSCVTVNLATAMVHRGARVCVFDADTGLSNINILLGLRPQFTLEHVLQGEKTIQDIVLRTEDGLAVIPGASGIAEVANLDVEKIKRLCAALTELEAEYDYFLIDTAAGVADNVMQFIESSPSTFLIITAEPTSLTDAFSLLKLLQQRNYKGRLRVIVNLAVDYSSAVEIYRRFATAVDKYLGLKVEYGGFVVRDDKIGKSVALQIPVVNLAGNSPGSRCLFALADNILKRATAENREAGLADYWKLIKIDSEERAVDELESGKTITETEQVEQPKEDVEIVATMDEMIGKLMVAMKARHADRTQFEAFFNDFVTAFVERFGNFPRTFRQLFFRWLESENHDAPRLLELTGTLEALYVARYHQPLFSLEDGIARLVAQCQGSETRLRELVKQLRTVYRQSFQTDVFDAHKEIVESIQKDDFTEEQFDHLLQTLGEAFNCRFKRAYQGQGELLLESTAEALAAMAADEKKIQDEISMLNESFQQLTSRRDALIAAISHAKNNGMTFNTKTSADSE